MQTTLLPQTHARHGTLLPLRDALIEGVSDTRHSVPLWLGYALNSTVSTVHGPDTTDKQTHTVMDMHDAERERERERVQREESPTVRGLLRPYRLSCEPSYVDVPLTHTENCENELTRVVSRVTSHTDQNLGRIRGSTALEDRQTIVDQRVTLRATPCRQGGRRGASRRRPQAARGIQARDGLPPSPSPSSSAHASSSHASPASPASSYSSSHDPCRPGRASYTAAFAASLAEMSYR